jgi:hypothetical protein
MWNYSNIEKNVCSHMLIEELFTIVQMRNKPKCPACNEWMKKAWYTQHSHTSTHKCKIEYSLALKKERNPVFHINMDEPIKVFYKSL